MRSSAPARRRSRALGGTSAPAPAKNLVTLLEKVGTLAPVFAQEREVRGDEEAVLRRDLPRLAADLTAT